MIAEIQKKYASGNVLVVSHKATIRIILCDLLGIDLGRYRDRIDMLAGAVSTVKFDLHGPLLQELGNRAYMGETCVLGQERRVPILPEMLPFSLVVMSR